LSCVGMAIVELQLGFKRERELEQYVPPAPQAAPVKSLALQINNATVSVAPVKLSVSDAFDDHVASAPGFVGPLLLNDEKFGRWFTTKGDAVFPVPCLNVALHAGLEAF
jgi:hypothetical protein